MGRFGQKTGAGWYDYQTGDRTPQPSSAVQDVIVECRKEEGIRARDINDKEITERLVYALVNEGARILQEGIAQRASDIDLVWLRGYGFPLWRGGPMFYADTTGLASVVQSMAGYAKNPHADPEFWEPAPLIARLAAEDKDFHRRDAENAEKIEK